MPKAWKTNIRRSIELLRSSAGPRLVLVAAGNALAVAHWRDHCERMARDTFRQDGRTEIRTILENTPKGNFLGSLNAWSRRDDGVVGERAPLPTVSLMNMSFGMGKRLSPFTQALGNRKSAFTTPLKGTISGEYLCTADVSNLYSNLWVEHLERSGFRGVVVKWGDEAVLPGIEWASNVDYSQADAVRFVWKTNVTADLARDKDWVLVDPETGLMRYQLPRQETGQLLRRLESFERRGYETAVNLGSLAVSYTFLEAASEVFAEDVANAARSVDWDPYVWTALCCKDASNWLEEARQERQAGQSGIRKLEARYPDFFTKVKRVRDLVESQTGRPFSIQTLDFGTPLWIDLGLHASLRRCLGGLRLDTEEARALRELFFLPQEQDERGNIIQRSTLPDGMDIQHSIVVDSIVTDPSSVMKGAVVVGGKFRRAILPYGGIALFSAAGLIEFSGPKAMCFRSVCERIELPEGGRHATVFLPSGSENMVSNEAIVEYSGPNYTEPIFDNHLSFQEAGLRASEIEGRELERSWAEAWARWKV